MSLRSPNSWHEKWIVFIAKAKQLISKDYSLQDLKDLGSLRSVLKGKLSSLKELNLELTHGVTFASTLRQWNLQNIIGSLQALTIRHLNTLLTLFILGLAALLYILAIAPYSQSIQDQIELRPAQWSQLQSLIKLSKSGANSAPTSVAMLDDMELMKIRNTLTSRGFKLGVFRLSAENPPRLELQASDVIFSVLLDTLEEMRITWRLYPEQLKIISTSSAGVVNVSGSLLQFTGAGPSLMSGGLK